MGLTKPRKRNMDEDVSDEIETESLPRAKKSRKASGVAKGGAERHEDEDGNPYWELSASHTIRRATISDFKGATLISIREFYEKDDKVLPGKKGISITVDQYKALLFAIPQINEDLRNKGVDVSDSGIVLDEDLEDGDVAGKRKSKSDAKPQRLNIEATSDEDED